MTMLKNIWYVAGWSDELHPGKPIGRTFLNEPTVMFRTAGGRPVALNDRCPHRFAPLHMGKQIGETIQCAYHGLEFDASGQCVRNPHSGKVPEHACTQAYPLVDRYGLLWIWMGDKAQADEKLIPEQLAFVADDKFAHVRLYLHGYANYLLLVDNLMDVSHALYLHAGSLTQESMRDGYEPQAKLEDGVATLRIHQAGITPPPFWSTVFPENTIRVDKHEVSQGILPSIVVHEIAYSQPGKPPLSEGGGWACGAHMYTPETDSSTHYFYSLARDYHRDSEEVQRRLETEVFRIFSTEDMPIIEAQQKLIGNRDLMSLKPALIESDRASVLMRRQLASRIDKEQAVNPGPG